MSRLPFCRCRVGAAGALLLASAAGAATPAAAQSPRLTGVVRDAGSRAPVAEAEVRLLDGAATRTDATGAFSLPLDRFPATLVVRRIGFQPLRRPVTADESAAPLELLLVATSTELAPVSVTATREATAIAYVPAAVAVVDSLVLKSGRMSGLHEALRYTPGVQATSRFGGDDVNLSIRGSGIRTTFGVRGVAVLLDGVPITEPDGQTRLDLIELGAARQVEVLRGPSSVIYGGIGVGGAVNVLTRSGAESRGITARVQQGTFGFQKYEGAVGTPFRQGRGGIYLSGAHSYSSGFRDFSRNRMTRGTLRADYRLGDRSRLFADVSYSTLDMNIPGALTQGEYRADPWQAVGINLTNRYARRDDRLRMGLRHEQTLDVAGRTLGLSSYAFYSTRDLDHPIFQVVRQDLRRVQLGTRLRLPVDRGADPVLRATFGADYDNLFGRDQRFVNARGSAGAPLSDAYIAIPNVGLFGQGELRLTPRLAITAGARYDRVTYNTENLLAGRPPTDLAFGQLSPRVTATWRTSGTTSLYANVSRGFEVPTLGEITVSPDPSQTFNLALRPKRLWNYEVGWKGVLARRVAVDAALFWQEIRNELVPRTLQTPTGPRTFFDNAGRSRNRGLELGATALVTDWLDLLASYTWSDFRLTDFRAPLTGANGSSVVTDFSGNRLPGVPVHRVAGEVRVRPLRRLAIGAGAEYQTRMFVDNANTTQGVVYFRPSASAPVQQIAFGAAPAFTLVHVNANYTTRHGTLFVSVENLLDRTYVANLSVNDGGGRFYSAGAGRYVAVGLSLTAFPGGF